MTFVFDRGKALPALCFLDTGRVSSGGQAVKLLALQFAAVGVGYEWETRPCFSRQNWLDCEPKRLPGNLSSAGAGKVLAGDLFRLTFHKRNTQHAFSATE